MYVTYYTIVMLSVSVLLLCSSDVQTESAALILTTAQHLATLHVPHLLISDLPPPPTAKFTLLSSFFTPPLFSHSV